MTAWLIEAEQPKSSALTMRRRGGEFGLGGLGAIVGRPVAEHESPPGAQKKQRLLPLVQARQLGAEYVEPPPLTYCGQSPAFIECHVNGKKTWIGKSALVTYDDLLSG